MNRLINSDDLTKRLRACALLAALVLGGCAGGVSVRAFTEVRAADVAYEKGDWARAERLYRNVTKAVPSDAYAYFRLGNVLVQQGRLEEAVTAYQEALVRDARLIKAYNNLAMVRLLQAEYTLAAAARAPEDSEHREQVRQLLNRVQAITRDPVEEVVSPAAVRPTANDDRDAPAAAHGREAQ